MPHQHDHNGFQRMSCKGQSKPPNKMLDLGEDEDEDVAGTSGGFTVNKTYAERYENWRRLEELQKMKDKYGENFEEQSESSESEEETEWTADDEKDFFKTLSALKGDDESIYNKDAQFWKEKTSDEGKPNNVKKEKVDKVKPMFLKDYERKLVERGGDIDESEEEEEDAEKDPSYYKKQEKNKIALKKAMNAVAESDDEEDLLRHRKKTDEEKKAEEESYLEWLSGNPDKVLEDKAKKELKSLKKAWTSSSLDADEQFLRDYILNKQYDVDKDGSHIPSYEEIVGTTLEEDEEMDDKASQFEKKFNFRYEEPDQDFIKQYPRSISESIRQTVGNKRQEKREEVKERKAREKEEKKAEIKQLKKMKKTEIEKKLNKLKKMAGDDIAVKIDDLEGDFDPKEYDRRMQELFNQEYYKNGGDGEDEMEKPVFSDLSSDEEGNESSDYDEMEVGEGGEDEEDDEVEESIETKPKKAHEAAEESMRKDKESSRRRRKRNSKFVEAVKRKKPIFDPKDKTFEEYFNEYYALDYEDILGDTRTRFKYRDVPANNFGLAIEEILEADDRQLNAWASLKKAVAYRTEKEEAYDISVYAKKGSDVEKKRRLLERDFGGKKSKKLQEEKEKIEAEMEKTNGEEKTENVEKKTKKKNKNKKKANANGENGQEKTEVLFSQTTVENANGGEEKKKGRSRKKRKIDSVNIGVNDERLKAYGINVKKFKGKLAYGQKKETTE